MCLSALLSKKIRVASTFLAIVNNADMNIEVLIIIFYLEQMEKRVEGALSEVSRQKVKESSGEIKELMIFQFLSV